MGGYRISNERNATLCFTRVEDVANVLKTIALNQQKKKEKHVMTYHVPITIKMKTSKFMTLFRTCKYFRDRGQEVRLLDKWEWQVGMENLPETNPIHPLRHYYKDGLGSCEGHNHVNTTQVLKLLDCEASGERLREYTSEEINRIVTYIFENSKILNTPKSLRLVKHKSRKRVNMKHVVHGKDFTRKMSSFGRNILNRI